MDVKGSKRKQGPELEAATQPLAKKAKKSKTKTRESHEEPSTSLLREKGRKEEFMSIDAHMTITIPPLYSGPGRPKQAALEMLDSMIMRYNPALGGVVLMHSNLKFLSTTATFLIDSPFTKAEISFTALVWSPAVGSRLRGSISICSPDHIGLLIHKTFNASIPRHHIPTDEWEFEYGPLENDPEYGAAALGEEQNERERSGRWIHTKTAKSIGGPTGEVEFTIIGLNISQSMFSLIGSLQSDPFNPRHQPLPAASPQKQQKIVAEDDDTQERMEEDEPTRYSTPDSEGNSDREGAILAGNKGSKGAVVEFERKTAKEAKLKKKKLKEEKKLRKKEAKGDFDIADKPKKNHKKKNKET